MEVIKERILDGEIRKDAIVDETILSCLCTMSIVGVLCPNPAKNATLSGFTQ